MEQRASSKLRDRGWKLYYDSGQDDLVGDFYLPSLSLSRRYDRVTGYFTPGALRLVSRGLEPFVARGGKMRLVTGCTLGREVVEAIRQGQRKLDEALASSLLPSLSLYREQHPQDKDLELLAWMVQQGVLSIKVALPCDDARRPVIHTTRIFHEKAGVMEDEVGDRLAFHGSVNETHQGWQGNWEGIHVFRSWQNDYERVELEDRHFQQLWADEMPRCLVLSVEQALAQGLLRFLPLEGEKPSRLRRWEEEQGGAVGREAEGQGGVIEIGEEEGWVGIEHPTSVVEGGQGGVDVVEVGEVNGGLLDAREADEAYRLEEERRREVWGIVMQAPALRGVGDDIGEATSAIRAWPHQRRAFLRMYQNWPPKLLIADEVGLGKTIEAGLLLRQAYLAGKLKRVLILAPKAVTRQWQFELREKFNLNWPIYTGQELVWYASQGQREKRRGVSRGRWHEEPYVIVSSQLMRRADRRDEILREASPYSLVLLDEAHHARRSGVASGGEGAKPNLLLSLMRRLQEKTEGLILLTATPMQVAPQELWDLLDLLGVPRAWSLNELLRFFGLVQREQLSEEEREHLVQLFQATEQHWGEMGEEQASHLTPDLSRFDRKRLLRGLRDKARIPRRKWTKADWEQALRMMRACTPVSCLISRHTRETLRRYAREGKLEAQIAMRWVEDLFIHLSGEERDVYEEVERYISEMYNRAASRERNAVGFVMTIYRRRMASSFSALSKTLKHRLQRLEEGASTSFEETFVEEEGFQDELWDAEESEETDVRALRFEEQEELRRLMRMVERLPVDTKARELHKHIQKLKDEGYSQCIIFTQYTDTMRFLRDHLFEQSGRRVVCFSGDGGEERTEDGRWVTISRDQAKALFFKRKADVMLCTDAAAEGLNFQFCGALINYDMPWNPMRVEQRIGRIDRLGQSFERIRVLNLHYRDTVEADVYAALRQRIALFTQFVGRLQPILSTVAQQIREVTLSRQEERGAARASLLEGIDRRVEELEQGGFDLDAILESAWMELPPFRPLYGLTELRQLLLNPTLLSSGVHVRRLSSEEVGYRSLEHIEEVRVTSSSKYFDQHPESVELWSQGSPVFQCPYARESLASVEEIGEVLRKDRERLKKIL